MPKKCSCLPAPYPSPGTQDLLISRTSFHIASQQNAERKPKRRKGPPASVAPLRDLREPEAGNGPAEQQVAVWGCVGLGPGLAGESLGQDPAVTVIARLHRDAGGSRVPALRRFCGHAVPKPTAPPGPRLLQSERPDLGIRSLKALPALTSHEERRG